MRLNKIFYAALNLYRYPSLFLHELSHIIVIYLLGNKISCINVEKSENLGISLNLTLDRFESKRKVFFYTMSPFFLFGLVGILAFFNTFFLILFIYMLTNLKGGLTLPSEDDYTFYKNCERYKEDYDKMLLEDPTIFKASE
jgi:hypothetical protein